jgi:hypothetical protein
VCYDGARQFLTGKERSWFPIPDPEWTPVAQLLTCPNRHYWDLTADPFAVLPLTRGLCPLCGEPPTADSPVDWDREYWHVLVLVPLLLFVIGPFFLIGFFLASHGQADVGGWPCIGALGVLFVSLALTASVRQWRRQTQVKAAAQALGFAFTPTVPRARALALLLPPFLFRPRLLADRRNCMEGTYQGSRVLLLDGLFRSPPSGLNTPQTVVVFLEPVPGLPDFQLEPGRDESKLRNRSLEQHLGLRPLNPFRDEPFGRHYRLAAGDAEAVRPWLSPPLGAFLERHKGWVVGAWHGRFYLYHPQRHCRADACATIIAVAWRLRDMLEQPLP